jgi:predicted nucleotide-binding protein (sugar kinase/HSP70/actin superfamily)
MSKKREFWEKIKNGHFTILAPDMLPIHFAILGGVLTHHGYPTVFVSPEGRQAKDEGLKAVHNDACYPAIIIAGQFLAELKSGRHDVDKTAVIITQTGGGCRASNYLSLIRKAIAKEFPQVPVLSLNLMGLEKERALPLSLPLAAEAVASFLYGDFLMALDDQARPYERTPGAAELAKNQSLDFLKKEIGSPRFLALRRNYRTILSYYRDLVPPKERKPKVAIVGEIYVKYSRYANNGLADFLLAQGVEPVFPSLAEFLLYCLSNVVHDHRTYGRNAGTWLAAAAAYRFLLAKTRQEAKFLREAGFDPYEDFGSVLAGASAIVDRGVKMGEGWLIPAEMLAYAKSGVKNIVCVQPFGCLPNHIVGKGLIRPLKALCPDINIVPLDFDASLAAVNQENRLKLMLGNLK